MELKGTVLTSYGTFFLSIGTQLINTNLLLNKNHKCLFRLINNLDFNSVCAQLELIVNDNESQKIT